MRQICVYIVGALLMATVAKGQQVNSYHIDRYNGLPSNHVYSTLVDKHGYLWICTDKGVVRYNGYEFKKYGLAEGLPTEDIWQMVEDKKGRIWMLSIGDGLGYIYNGKYHAAIFDKPLKSIRPYDVRCMTNGIFFLTPYAGPSAQGLAIERNDTIFTYDIYKYVLWGHVSIDEDNNIKHVFNSGVYELTLTPLGVNKRTICLYDKLIMEPIIAKDGVIYGHYLISYVSNDNWFSITDLKKCGHKDLSYKYLIHKNEYINIIETNNDFLYLINNKNIYELNKNFNLIKVINVDSIIGRNIHENNVSYMQDNAFWGKCLSTYNDGIYIHKEKHKQFRKFESTDLSNYISVGENFDRSFWWNKTKKIIIEVKENGKIGLTKKVSISKINKIINTNKGELIMCSGPTNCTLSLLNSSTGEIKKLIPNSQNVSEKYFNPNSTYSPVTSISFNIWKDAIADSANDYYSVLTSNGLAHVIIKGDSTTFISIDKDFYQKITYDSSTTLFWAYNNHKILIFDRKNNKCLISNEVLTQLGIKNLESIKIDNHFGNIFIKDYNKILIYNYRTQSFYQPYKNYNLNDATVHLFNNKLIVVGKFGILFSKVLGEGTISAPIVYSNIKNRYYFFVIDCSVSNNQVLLNTDKGAYLVDIPHDSTFNNNPANTIPNKFLLLYDNNLIDLNKGDTINIDQKNAKLQFDIINPEGNGLLHYLYKLNESDASSQLLNANELNLPHLTADRYYKLSLIAYDDVWKSNVKMIQLYVIPYWWQTNWGKRIIWVGVVMGVLLIGIVIVIITKKIVSQRNEKKNLQLGLELNAVYSQINPHFVFNTLNTAQYFIKKKKTDEAFIHINKFSRLLRAYIKSSRNKFISIEEEVINLKNYIELQQERFEDRFDYQLIINNKEELNTKKIPSLLLQPIVENAINHGIFHKEDKGHLLIELSFDKNKNEIICVIDDDGIGRKKSKEISENSSLQRESYGDQLIKELINVFNKYEKIHISMMYFDKTEPNTGTRVTLTIKNLGYDR